MEKVIGEERKSPPGRIPGKAITAGIALLVLSIFSVELTWRHHAQRLAVRTCFQNGVSLKEGAPVFVAGVKVGYVSRLSTNPANQDCAIQAEMVLDSAYQFTIPTDSTVSVQTTETGATQALIHIENASGPPLEQGGVLISGH
jgi:ABC-type transporter Mla subunit MlaD